ncbi:glycosyltransferase family 2 protein [Lacihabitans sp. CS3-21]|uniref:glycosyltransferase family 2 protein n=1 Tax=Lacihabitans sp. CS3-21 TaxID=2487332 RepID=UPI0020CD4CD8|nr:glycosyltransferase family 2 protein [Lacihabitans sp. CS3-21]MCP9746182.1 glycosyltransferase family 2 protein [Lacihabitans sp. CS3-21]
MKTLEISFWIMLGITFYAYVGYGILLYVLVKIKNWFVKKPNFSNQVLPEVTLLVAAYNESDYVVDKVKNTIAQSYPSDKLKIVFVTDGTTDDSIEKLKSFEQVKVYHSDERKGKMAAINRVMPLIKSPITVFTDANAMLNTDAIKSMVEHFVNPKVGVVAGEKQIIKVSENNAEVGEGLYWKYESFLKKLDSELYSTVGAAGELYAIRTSLFQTLETDTLLDDFVLSLRICSKGYVTAYEPSAKAMETASLNIAEELKRKVRISAGGIQSVLRLQTLLNPFKHGWLTFQYLSHRVLRWTLVPVFLVLMPIVNLFLMDNPFYQLSLFFQVAFYSLAILGYVFEKKGKKFKALYVPYYFSFMNYAAILGFKRFYSNQQAVTWEKAARA